MLSEPFLCIVRIDTGGVVDGGVVLNNGGDLATITMEEFAGPVADITKALQGECLVLKTLCHSNLVVE